MYLTKDITVDCVIDYVKTVFRVRDWLTGEDIETITTYLYIIGFIKYNKTRFEYWSYIEYLNSDCSEIIKERAQVHGNAKDCFENIYKAMDAALDSYKCKKRYIFSLCLMKLARMKSNNYSNVDDLVDAINYMRLADMA